VLSLSLWASLPFYLERYGRLASSNISTITTWEVLVLILPITGVVAAVYGRVCKSAIFAFLLGVIPYSPLILLGIPAILFLGTPMGIIGAGSTLPIERRIGLGIFLTITGIAWWGISTYLILTGFR